MSEHLPVILIEHLRVFGGVLLFTVWQLRSVKRDRAKTRAERAARQAAEAAAAQAARTKGAPMRAAPEQTASPSPAAERSAATPGAAARTLPACLLRRARPTPSGST